MLSRSLLSCSFLSCSLFSCSLLFLSAPPVLSLGTEPLSPRIANYRIDVSLDTEKQMLSGLEVLTWNNTSSDTVEELQFHLYLNAFRNNKSTFWKESRGRSRGFDMGEDGWGFIEVDRVVLLSGEDPGVDLTETMEFIRPDDGNEDDMTVFRLPLPNPVLPGGSAALNISFIAKLPEPPFCRTGTREEYFLVGQWFPKIGVYTDNGWNCHQFHELSEFFADFGVYDVTITVPTGNIVGATGVEVEVTDNGDGTSSHYYRAEDVHDFAWTTSPEFVEFTRTVRDVEVRLLMQPDHTGQSERHLEAAEVAIEYIQDWFGDYPYPNLTIVDPRRRAGGSGGMEYPTLITSLTRYGLPQGIRMVESVIIHEFAHNYWYHLVASNEFEESWLDEGLTTFTETEVMREAYGAEGNMIDLFGVKVNDLTLSRIAYLLTPDSDHVLKNSWDFYSENSWAANSFFKPSLMLTTLQNLLGEETMRDILRTYADRWRFRHPTTEDFLRVADEVSGRDLSWFFDQALRSRAVLDYSVTGVITREAEEEEGYDFTISVPEGDTIPDTIPDAADSLETEEDPQLYYSEVRVRRLGEFTFPVDIEVVFEDGVTVHEYWDGIDHWKKFRYVRKEKLVSATIDPDGKIPLDINLTNNSRTVDTQWIALTRLCTRWMFWVQLLIEQPDITNAFSRIGPGS